MTTMPSGTVTFLFTDIEGSTRLAPEHSDRWEMLRARHHAILRSACEAHHGDVFQVIGDAFCVAFHTARYRPPATSRQAPVIYDASSDNNQSIAWATSSTCPPRCIGTEAFTRSTRCGSPPLA